MRKLLSLMLITLILTGVSGHASAEGGAFDEANFSATLTMTSDYVSRGISYTDGEPAIQGSFDYAHPSGFYLGIWASNWEDSDPSGSNIEIDYYGGYDGEWDSFTYDLSVCYYDYPDANDDAAEYNYYELIAKLNYHFTAPLSPVFGIGYAYSPEYSGEDGASNYINGTLDLTLPLNLTLSFEAGYQDIKGDKTTGNGGGLDDGNGYDYIHWRVGLATKLKGFSLDVSYHDTNESGWLSDNIGQADERVVFTVSRSF
ncbi:MAG: hypothetical protein JRJ47_02380 [Deltaproteobacteria bacterium]|nr:hypothetical protein [Deltaproteobacteria bacterium]